MSQTNVMRLLKAAGVAYVPFAFAADKDDLSGLHAAAALGVPTAEVFKTIVLCEDSAGFFVCCIPSDGEIDLRRAAKATGIKRAELLPLKELQAVTGYVRGGCSPIGMRRRYPVFVDESALRWERIFISAGARGKMVSLAPSALLAFTGARVAALTTYAKEA